jgi:O-antigen/teichoic acid export membrane protein
MKYNKFLATMFKSKLPTNLLSNAIWQYASSFGTLGFGFAYVLCLGRYLGTAEFGLFSLCLSACTLTFNLVELRLNETIIRYVTQYWEANDAKGTLSVIHACLILDVITGIVAFMVLLGLSPWLQEHFLRDTRGVTILCLCGLSVFFGKVGSVAAVGVLRVFDKYKWVSIASMIGAAVKLLSVLIGIYLRVDLVILLILAVVCSLATNIFLVFVSFACLKKKINLKLTNIDATAVLSRFKEMRKFITTNYFISILEVGFKDLDMVMLGWLSSKEVAGVYKIAKTFVALVAQVTDPVVFVLLPEFSKLYINAKFRECASLIKRLTMGLGIISFFSFLISFWAVPNLIILFLGESYGASGVIFQSMSWWIPIVMPLMWAHSLSCAANKPNLYLFSSMAGNLLGVVLYISLIPRFGGFGASVTYAIVISITSILAASSSWRCCISKKIHEQNIFAEN